MSGEQKYVLKLTESEQTAIFDLLCILDNCGIEMNDTDYMNICRAIKNKETSVDELEEFSIEYEEDEINE